MALLGSPFFRVLDANGDPVSGGKVAIFGAGTSTAVTTYSNYAMTVTQTHPVVADSEGEVEAIYVAPGLYKVRELDADDVLLREYDFQQVIDPSTNETSADLGFDVASDYATFQAAFDKARGYTFEGVAKININGEAAQPWDTEAVSIRGDHSGTVLTSAGSTIQVPAGFTSTDYGLNLDESCHGLTFETKLDMNGAGRGGINALDSVTSLFFQPNSGVINSGNNGTDPKGANLMTSGKVVCFWDAGAQEGADFSGSASRGVWVTYGGNFGGKYCDFSNTGTSRDIGDDNAGLFVSRGATAHADNSNFSGSKMGLRVGRGRGNARDSDFTSIDGHAVFCFETGVATVTNGDFTGSGYWTGSVNYSVLYRAGSSSNRPQGGGRINAESSTFTNCVGDIAECKGSDSIINIDNSTGTGLEGAVAEVSGGLVTARSSSFTASATCRAAQMVQSSNAGEFEGLGVTLDANNQVDHCVRVSDGGKATLKGATLANAGDTIFDFGTGGGEIYVQETTIDGTSYFPNGVWLRSNADFPLRSEAVSAVGFGFILADGKGFSAAGLRYKFLAGSTVIPDMPGVVPVYPARPEHFGAAGDGTTDDTAALVAWAAYGGVMETTAGATYRSTTVVSGATAISFAASCFVNGNGATIQFEETDTTNNFRIAAAADVVVKDVRFLWTDNAGSGHYFERAFNVQDRVILDGVTFEAATEQPDTTDDSGYDTCLRIDGDDVTLLNTKFINIWDACRAQPTTGQTGFRAFDTEISGYSSGFTLAEFGSDVVIDGLKVISKNSAASTNAGENAITGGCSNLTVKNVEVWASGEHAIYLASGGTLSSPVYGLTMQNVRVRSSGQCAVKIRGWGDVVLQDVHGGNAAMGNTPGTNEDGLRIEECTNVRVFAFSHGNEDDGIASGTGTGGYDGIHIDSCTNVDLYDVQLDTVQRAAIRIEDDRVNGSVDGIRFHGLTVKGATVPILDIDVTGNLGDVIIHGLKARDATDHIVQIDAAGTVGRVYVGGDFATTSTTPINNVAGGAAVMIDSLDNARRITPYLFGAVADDSGSKLRNTAAFQAAADHVGALGGGTVWVDGTFYLGADNIGTDEGTAVTLTASHHDVAFVGEAGATIIPASNKIQCFVQNGADRVRVEGIHFDNSSNGVLQNQVKNDRFPEGGVANNGNAANTMIAQFNGTSLTVARCKFTDVNTCIYYEGDGPSDSLGTGANDANLVGDLRIIDCESDGAVFGVLAAQPETIFIDGWISRDQIDSTNFDTSVDPGHGWLYLTNRAGARPKMVTVVNCQDHNGAAAPCKIRNAQNATVDSYVINKSVRGIIFNGVLGGAVGGGSIELKDSSRSNNSAIQITDSSYCKVSDGVSIYMGDATDAWAVRLQSSTVTTLEDSIPSNVGNEIGAIKVFGDGAIGTNKPIVVATDQKHLTVRGVTYANIGTTAKTGEIVELNSCTDAHIIRPVARQTNATPTTVGPLVNLDASSDAVVEVHDSDIDGSYVSGWFTGSGTYDLYLYASGSDSLTLTFQTAGDASFTNVTATFDWTRAGKLVTGTFDIEADVTHTTASGQLRATGLEFRADALHRGSLGHIRNVNLSAGDIPYSAITSSSSYLRFNYSDVTGASDVEAIRTNEITTGTTNLELGGLISYTTDQ